MGFAQKSKNIFLPCIFSFHQDAVHDEHASEAALSGHDHHQPWNRNELLQTVNQHSPTNQLNLVPANTSTAIELCVTVQLIKCCSDNCLVSTTLMQISIISDQNSMIISYTSSNSTPVPSDYGCTQYKSGMLFPSKCGCYSYEEGWDVMEQEQIRNS